MLRLSAPVGVVVVATLALAAQGPAAMHAGQAAGDVIVHEWGTFTTVAGEDGRAVQWLPLGGPSDLPCFVYAFDGRLRKFGIPRDGRIPDYTTARATLKGTVRMETPVLYFYAPRPTVVDVSVDFRKGIFTEWYPMAWATQASGGRNLSEIDDSLSSSIAWKHVSVVPDTRPVLPQESSPSHYYAARATDAVPVQVYREQEKFLFYRGVAGFDAPIAATLADNGTVTISNLSGAEIPQVMLFTRQGPRLGYRTHGPMRAEAHVTLDRPVVYRPLDAVLQELEQTLIAQGLYPREAKAMIETWRDSWFEDGTRVFYIVPPSTVDAVLPLQVDPKPADVVRVFVGRAEVITPADISAVTTAFATNDRGMLERYGRRLGPIADRILADTTSRDAQARMRARLDAMLKSYAASIDRCGAQPPRPAETTASLDQLAALPQ